MAVPKYFSAEQYAKMVGMGPEEIKRQCRIGKIECLRTEKGHYKIPVYEGNAVSRDKYDSVVEENIKLKTILEQFCNTAKQLI